MSEFEFRNPEFLLLAALAPLVFWLAARTPAAVVYSSLELLDQAPRSFRARLSKLPALLLSLATVAMAIAISGPRIGDSTTRVKREGIAICMVVDQSGSMRAEDLQLGDEVTTRLDAVREVFREFVMGRDGESGRVDDLIGLVGFAAYADGLCPLTLDHPNLIAILEDLDFAERYEDGTALGEGLALAVERLREHPARSKVVILLTDGVNNAGEITPMQAADLAAEHGIKVYTIGAGTNGMAPMRVQDQYGRVQHVRQRVQIDEDTLRSIAAKNGGEYYRATDGEALRNVIAQIDQLERSEIIEIRYLNYTERYTAFVILALALLAGAGLSSATFLRRLP